MKLRCMSRSLTFVGFFFEEADSILEAGDFRFDLSLHHIEGLVHDGIVLKHLLWVPPEFQLKYLEKSLMWSKSASFFMMKAKTGALTKATAKGLTAEPKRLAR